MKSPDDDHGPDQHQERKPAAQQRLLRVERQHACDEEVERRPRIERDDETVDRHVPGHEERDVPGGDDRERGRRDLADRVGPAVAARTQGAAAADQAKADLGALVGAGGAQLADAPREDQHLAGRADVGVLDDGDQQEDASGQDRSSDDGDGKGAHLAPPSDAGAAKTERMSTPVRSFRVDSTSVTMAG